ncbi:MAG TPA: capsule assembly Wzi family protein [Candidatus Dormibacteraeota bacterium]|nr:capsule assembly Wzi family protein [Candidatus Dormibacteraeota bacterium]
MCRDVAARFTVFRILLMAYVLAMGGFSPGPRPAAAQPAEFLPSSHALYEDLEALVARGLLPSFAIHTRPLARADIARALLDAREKDPSIESDLHYQRLERELAREFEDAGNAPRVKETGPLIDVGGREERFRVALAGHARGDFEDKRRIHYRLLDESSFAARMGLELRPGFGAYEELGITRIRGQRGFIDAVAAHTDLEATVLRAELTARVGKITGALGYDSFRWGPGRRGTLLLSDAAGPMGFFLLQGSTRGKVGVTASALNAVISMADHRYLAAHRIEVEIAPRWNIGIAEAARYSSDGVDLLYASGLLPYTIVERIRIREASSDSLRPLERANVMASADVSFRALRALTLYGELLVDDYATESASMPNRIGYQLGFRSDRPWGARAVHFLGEYTRVRNFTYSVYYGEDYIYRNRPLGYSLGPDAENVYLESAFDISRDWQLRWSGDFTNHGEGRLGVPWQPSMGAVSTAGLSGIVEERREVWGDARWMPRDNVDLSVGAGFRRLRNEGNVSGADRESWLARFAAEVRY